MQRDDAATALGRICQERDEARAKLKAWEGAAVVCKEIERERDEARAIARQLAEALNCYANLWQGHFELLTAFDALPWAREPAA